MTFSAEARAGAISIQAGRDLSIKKFEPELKITFRWGEVDPEKVFLARIWIRPPRQGLQNVVAFGRTPQAALNKLMIDLRKRVREAK